jgi:hypothetical protein
VFGAVFNETGNPALAVRALLTTLLGMFFYDHVFQFSASAPANIISDVSVFQPTGQLFSYAVIGLILLHLILFLLVKFLSVIAEGIVCAEMLNRQLLSVEWC